LRGSRWGAVVGAAAMCLATNADTESSADVAGSPYR
jgi:hypothetical protein